MTTTTQVPQWEDASKNSYTARSVTVEGLTVTVCDDDEGLITPAYYWDITGWGNERLADGWASSINDAEDDALATARSIIAEGNREDGPDED